MRTFRRILKHVLIHTDGACEGNPGPGGWAAILRYNEHEKRISGGAADTTNNRMEMQAAVSALDALKEECEVTLYTDSQYLKKGITEWVRGWKARGWVTAEKQPVKNRELWQQLDLLASRHKVTWKWVRGHNGNRDNEACDELARAEVKKVKKTLRK